MIDYTPASNDEIFAKIMDSLGIKNNIIKKSLFWLEKLWLIPMVATAASFFMSPPVSLSMFLVPAIILGLFVYMTSKVSESRVRARNDLAMASLKNYDPELLQEFAYKGLERLASSFSVDKKLCDIK